MRAAGVTVAYARACPSWLWWLWWPWWWWSSCRGEGPCGKEAHVGPGPPTPLPGARATRKSLNWSWSGGTTTRCRDVTMPPPGLGCAGPPTVPLTTPLPSPPPSPAPGAPYAPTYTGPAWSPGCRSSAACSWNSMGGGPRPGLPSGVTALLLGPWLPRAFPPKLPAAAAAAPPPSPVPCGAGTGQCDPGSPLPRAWPLGNLGLRSRGWAGGPSRAVDVSVLLHPLDTLPPLAVATRARARPSYAPSSHGGPAWGAPTGGADRELGLPRPSCREGGAGARSATCCPRMTLAAGEEVATALPSPPVVV